MTKFDPYAALNHQFLRVRVAKEMAEEAIALIEDDRPNAASRLLIKMLEGEIDKRLSDNPEWRETA